MGQAKLRGTFEQRREQGIARRERERLERVAKRAEREQAQSLRVAAMPRAERKRYTQVKINTAAILALAGALACRIRR